MPLDLYDFPQVVRDAVEVFNRLPDRLVSTDYGPMYTGKDIAAIDVLFNHIGVPQDDRKLCLELVQHMDSKSVKKEAERIKKLASKKK